MVNRKNQSIVQRKTTPNSSDPEIDAKDLDCPVCFDTTHSLPVYQCTNGHFVCNDCIPKLKECPICRNDSPPIRSQKFEAFLKEKESYVLSKGAIQNLDWDRNLNYDPQEEVQQVLVSRTHQDRFNTRRSQNGVQAARPAMERPAMESKALY